MKVTRLFILSFLFFMAGCCGYSTRSLLPGYLKTVHVSDVENRTLEPVLGEDLRDQLLTAFTTDGRLRVSSDPSADLMLTVTINRYERSAAVYTADTLNNVGQWRYELRYSAECRDQVKNSVLWQGSQTVFLNLEEEIDEEEGKLQLIEHAAEDIVRNILLAW